MKQVLLASNNPGKVKEVMQILSNLDIKMVTPNDVFDEKVDVDETGDTFEQNAFLKASQMGDMSGLVTIADDSGLEIDALNGEPGVYSARYAPTPEECIQKVLKNLRGVRKEKRAARFRISICIYDPNTKQHQSVDGSVEGLITEKPEGGGGFGYDPIFYSVELGKTFAQATQEEKNTISHRKVALEKLKTILPRYLS